MLNDHLTKHILSPQRKFKKKITIGIMIALFLLITGIVLFQITKIDITLITNEGEQVVSTHADTVKTLLQKQKIDVSENDIVSPTLDTKIEEGMTIQWDQAMPITINLNDETLTVHTTKTVVRDILQEAGIDVSVYDKVSLALDSEIDKKREIDILQAFEVAVVVGKQQKNVWTTVMSVNDFLKKQGISLGEYDRVNYDLNATIQPNMKIEVIQVEKVMEVVEESLPYSTEKQIGNSLLKGQSKVVTKGVDGKRTVTYEIVKENGEPVVKTIVTEEVTKEPVTEVVLIGNEETKPVVARSKSPKKEVVSDKTSNASNVFAKVENEPKSSKKELIVEATAYTPFCEGCSGITKTGLNVRLNTNIKVIAVDPLVIPLGTRVWVEGYGYAIAADIGSDIKNNRIDVLMHSKIEVFKWGRRQVRVKIL